MPSRALTRLIVTLVAISGVMAISPATGSASGELSLSVSAPTTATMPDGVTFHISISTDRIDAAAFSAYVVDHNYNYVGGCEGASCSVTVKQGVLEGGGRPVTETFHVKAGAWPGYDSDFADRTVTFSPPNWKVSLSLPEEATMPDPIPVGIDITPRVWAPNKAFLFNEPVGSYADFSCAPDQGSCQGSLNTGWWPTPVVKTYRAAMEDGATVMAEDEKTVTILPPSLGITIWVPSDVLPGHSYTIKITNAYGRYSPWLIAVRGAQGQVLGYCHTDDATCEVTATAGAAGTSQSYTADASWGSNTLSSTSSVTVRSIDPATVMSGPGGLAGVDIYALAAMYGSASAACNALLFFPGTHTGGSSATDQWLACDGIAQSGGTAEAAIRAALGAMIGVAAAGAGQSLLDWLQNHAWINYGDNDPPANPTDPPVNPPTTAPSPTPPAVAGQIEALTDSLLGRNTGVANLTRARAKEIARQCLYYVSQARLAGGELCETLPILAPGADYPGATQARIDALTTRDWRWVRLQRREGKRSRWYESQPECNGSTQEMPCDEFPENRTYQGGDPSTGPGAPKTRPWLTQIPRFDNSGMGAQLNALFSSCGLRDSSSFLVVPTPIAAGVPTMRLCNLP